MAKKLPNYLRTYRKRFGFTQDEIAYLLGCQNGAMVSRYERYRRRPGLKTVFAYQAIFKIPAHELFPGIYEEVESEILKRTQNLAKWIERNNPNRRNLHKLKNINNTLLS